MTRLRHRLLPAGPALAVVLALVACGTDAVVPTATPTASAAGSAPSDPSRSPSVAAIGDVQPPPGSSSAIFAPNPGQIVVAIEAGHGGCLDWGVPDPAERGPDHAEKAITMSIARALADRLAADGVRALLVRDGDEALAGDRYPPLSCDGAPFRDVNGDGVTGFGPDVPEGTRTRDELQARLDLANLARVDVLVSIHVDSITDGAGNLLPIARTETFYTDETPWGVPEAERLAASVQESLVASMEAAADYERQDRGINAHNLYIVAPPLVEPTDERPDPWRQPTRGALMPAILVEVGTITLAEEHELLLSEAGSGAAADGILDGLQAWFEQRELAGRVTLDGEQPGAAPVAVEGDGPPFRAPALPDGPLRLRVTNTGTLAWDGGARLVAAWTAIDGPYRYGIPEDAAPIGPELPPLEPGASVTVEVPLPEPSSGEGLAWFSLSVETELLADRGSPALQLITGAP